MTGQDFPLEMTVDQTSKKSADRQVDHFIRKLAPDQQTTTEATVGVGFTSQLRLELQLCYYRTPWWTTIPR